MKGVSAIIATVLLLMMTVAAAAGAYYWMTNVLTGIQEGGDTQTQDLLERQNTAIRIVTADCDSNGVLTVNVRNTGTVNIRGDVGDWSATIALSSSPDSVVALDTLSSQADLLVGTIGEFTFTFDEVLSSGAYSIVIETPKGIQAQGTCTVS